MKKIYLIGFILLILMHLSAAEPDTLRFQEGKMKSPALAIGLSMVFPGAGQMYNNKWFKGAIFLTAETGLALTAGYYYIAYNNDMTQESLSNAKQFTWFFAAVYAYSLIDAYVDAHLSAFPSERFILEPDPETNGVQLSYVF